MVFLLTQKKHFFTKKIIHSSLKCKTKHLIFSYTDFNPAMAGYKCHSDTVRRTWRLYSHTKTSLKHPCPAIVKKQLLNSLYIGSYRYNSLYYGKAGKNQKTARIFKYYWGKLCTLHAWIWKECLFLKSGLPLQNKQ